MTGTGYFLCVLYGQRRLSILCLFGTRNVDLSNVFRFFHFLQGSKQKRDVNIELRVNPAGR